MISSKELALSCIEITKISDNTDDVISSFIAFLGEYNLFFQLPSILRYLEYHRLQESQLKTLQIESPFEISEILLENIKVLMHAPKNVKVCHIQQEGLIGGFRAQYQGFVTDASILHNLQVLKKQLIKQQ